MTQFGKLTARFAAAAALVYLSFAAAQPPVQGPPGNRPPTLEERVAALERGLASVTTRFEIRESAVPPSQSGAQNAAAFESRVSNLERSIDRLAARDTERAACGGFGAARRGFRVPRCRARPAHRAVRGEPRTRRAAPRTVGWRPFREPE